jgi:enoyl-CoA hydratase
MSDASEVLLESDGAIRIVTLNRPHKLNAADLALHTAFAAVWSTIAADGAARAVVLTGAGRAFSAGGDYEFLTGQPLEAGLAASLHDATIAQMEGILGLALPVVAAVNGPAIGFGASIVALCDIVVMADDAYLSEPHSGYGLAPSPGLELMWPRLTSLAMAKELTMLGRRVGAAEALQIGLANRVVPAGTALAAAVALARELADVEPKGVALAKAAYNRPVLDAMRQRADAWGDARR